MMNQKVLRCLLPSQRANSVVNFHSATGDDDVNMGVIDCRVTSPSMQHGELTKPTVFQGIRCTCNVS